MAYDIPGLGESKQGVPTFWDIVLKNGITIGETKLTATASDLNLAAGLVAGAITTGFGKYFEKEIDCSAGDTAQTAALLTVPAGATIMEVSTFCTEAFNGDATTTFEVGIVGNTDKYIDPVDCPVTLAGVMSAMSGTNNDQKIPEPLTAALALIATWTNTASATAGKVRVRVLYF